MEKQDATVEFQPMVNFVVAGAQKSGTTALRSFLSQHPDIGLVDGGSETHFFNKHSAAAARKDYDLYHAMYTPQALSLCTGDVTPIYLYRADCLPAIQQYNPDMKLIVLLRNPVDRAYSHWGMERKKKKESRGFLPALLHEARYLRTHGQHPVYSYIQRSFYDAQIARLHRLFPAENCLILRNEDLRNAHSATLSKVFRFLGVSEMIQPAPAAVRTGSYAPMHPVIRRGLTAVFRKDIRRLEARLNWDLSDWCR